MSFYFLFPIKWSYTVTYYGYLFILDIIYYCCIDLWWQGILYKKIILKRNKNWVSESERIPKQSSGERWFLIFLILGQKRETQWQTLYWRLFFVNTQRTWFIEKCSNWTIVWHSPGWWEKTSYVFILDKGRNRFHSHMPHFKN